jgi:proteic killer suppression protein
MTASASEGHFEGQTEPVDGKQACSAGGMHVTLQVTPGGEVLGGAVTFQTSRDGEVQDGAAVNSLSFGVIRSWANRSTRRFAEDGKGRFAGLDHDLARRRLRLLDQARRLEDLTGLSSVGLRKLRGARKRQWSISAGGPWRITFTFRDGDAWELEIVDYP